MRTVLLVRDEEAILARIMERKLLDLPQQSGILFAGVSVEPAESVGNKPTYRVWIGCHREFSEKLMRPLVEMTLRDEIAAGAIIQVESHRGLGRVSL